MSEKHAITSAGKNLSDEKLDARLFLKSGLQVLYTSSYVYSTYLGLDKFLISFTSIIINIGKAVFK